MTVKVPDSAERLESPDKMDDEDIDLTTVLEIETSGDPKRDKVCACFDLHTIR
jgi:hypothetical protein